jgi:cell division protein ZapA (FtsZ GTPase activity inhibitor)
MAEQERLVSFTLLGQDYSFYTAASEQEMSKILDLVRQLTEESVGGAKSGTIPVSKTAIMACLNIASRYIKLQQDFEEYRRENDARATDLIKKIDATLPMKKEGGRV